MAVSTQNLIKYQNKGVSSIGDNYRLTYVSKLVADSYSIAIVDGTKNSVYRLSTSGNGDVFQFLLFQYQFSDQLRMMVLYDLDYAILVFGPNTLSFIDILGL